MKQHRNLTARISTFAASTLFFRIIVGVFIVESLWIACTGRYPMAFDEDFHLGLIRIYAQHISPFFHQQPAGADSFGAVARDPSFLYHWVMSFPYRFISLFSHNEAAQVLFLRFINVGLFALTFPLSRRLLRKTGAADSLIHICLAIFILIPVVPLMASQINYDNAFIPLTALSLLLTLRVFRDVKGRTALNVSSLAWLIIVCLLTSLVKYVFLPIFLAIVVYVALRMWRNYLSWRALRSALLTGAKNMSVQRRWLLTLLFALALGMFIQRDGINLVRYHTPVPSCDQVLTVRQCSSYGPWIRDYGYRLIKGDASDSPLSFTKEWFYGMWLRLFFTLDGSNTDFQTRGPLAVPAISAIIFSSIGGVLLIVYWRCIVQQYARSVLVLFIGTAGFYTFVLWLNEYQSYVRTGQPVAINGRYLLPLMLPVLFLLGLSYAELTRNRPRFASMLSALVIGSLLLGGGTLTYILRSNDDWYWHNPIVRQANHAVQHVVGPVVPGYSRPTAFLRS